MANDTDNAACVCPKSRVGLRRCRIGALGVPAQGYPFSATVWGQVFIRSFCHLARTFNRNWDLVLVEQVVGFSDYSGHGTRQVGRCRTHGKDNRKR